MDILIISSSTLTHSCSGVNLLARRQPRIQLSRRGPNEARRTMHKNCALRRAILVMERAPSPAIQTRKARLPTWGGETGVMMRVRLVGASRLNLYRKKKLGSADDCPGLFYGTARQTRRYPFPKPVNSPRPCARSESRPRPTLPLEVRMLNSSPFLVAPLYPQEKQIFLVCLKMDLSCSIPIYAYVYRAPLEGWAADDLNRLDRC